MIVSGVKHACATCIRGHRSSSCTHADRELHEIRKKGRPISQCPHCRDLRKIKSCHTRCECGETAAEQASGNKCQCHSGQTCSCAGPVQVYQYIPAALSSRKSSASNSTIDEAKTPTEGQGSMLHTFSTAATARPSHSGSGHGTAFSQMKNHISGPYTIPARSRELKVEEQLLSPFPLMPVPMDMRDGSPHHHHHTRSPAPLIPVATTPGNYLQNMLPMGSLYATHSARDTSMFEASNSTRSIGTSTDPLPAGIWPQNLFEMPAFQAPPASAQSLPAEHNSTQLEQSLGAAGTLPPPTTRTRTTAAAAAVTDAACPKAKDMSLGDLGFDPYNLTESSNRVPTFTTVYHRDIGDGDATTLMALDHYEEDEFDPEYFESLFDVPGCSLPGVQCRCGDNCSCAGCQTHRDNHDQVAFKDFAKMDFADNGSSVVAAAGTAAASIHQHPATCCDTRTAHMHPA